jgi:hypothetical protein
MTIYNISLFFEVDEKHTWVGFILIRSLNEKFPLNSY